MIDEMKRQKRELVYKGSILDIYKDTMQFANGKTEEWDFVSHRKGAAAVPPRIKYLHNIIFFPCFFTSRILVT